MQASKHSIVALWAVPRSVSTAFERMMSARGDFTIFNEPWSRCYYFGPDRRNERYAAETPSANREPTQILEGILSAAGSGPVFFKDMAYHATHYLDTEHLRSFTNTIIIRDPRLSVVSLYKKMPDFTLEETGFEALADFADRIIQLTGEAPHVVDGEDLRANPEAVCRGYCDAANIPFAPDALQWEAGREDHWNHWQEWFDDAAKSQGFKPPQREIDEETLRIPKVAEAVEYCMPYYEKLIALRS